MRSAAVGFATVMVMDVHEALADVGVRVPDVLLPTTALAWFTLPGSAWRAIEGRTTLKQFLVPAEVD